MNEYNYSVNNLILTARQREVDFVESFAMDMDNFLRNQELSEETKKFMDKLLFFMDDVLIEVSNDCKDQVGDW